VLGTRTKPVDLVDTARAATGTAPKILVTYATRCGSTGSVAERIGQVLCTSGATAEVRPVKTVQDLGSYRAVVVGSAIRMGRWLPEATRFVEQQQSALLRVPVALFCVCMSVADGTIDGRRTAAAYLDPPRKLLGSVAAEGLLAGTMDYARLPFLYRSLMRAIKQEEGDYRDWAAVEGWAGDLYSRLVTA
jgi:menaquinone-dependent protoporphyrinogen oxidase